MSNRPTPSPSDDQILPLTERPLLRMKLVISLLIFPMIRFIYDASQVTAILRLARMSNVTLSETLGSSTASGDAGIEMMKWVCSLTPNGDVDCGVGRILISIKATQMAMNIYHLALTLKMLKFNVNCGKTAKSLIDAAMAAGMCWNLMLNFNTGKPSPVHVHHFISPIFRRVTIEFLFYVVEATSLFVLIMLAANVCLQRYPSIGRHHGPREHLHQVRVINANCFVNIVQVCFNQVGDFAVELVDLLLFAG